MSLQRWMLFTPFAALIAAGVGTRVASCSRTGTKTPAAAGAARPLAIQPPRAFDVSAATDTANKSLATGDADGLVVADANRFALLPSAFYASSSSGNAPDIRFDASSALRERSGEGYTSSTYAANGSPNVIGRSKKRGTASGSAENSADEAAYSRWKAPKYEDWKPAAVYGPPLPPERERAQGQAHRLLQDLQAGRLAVMVSERDGEQLRCLERNGVYCWPAPPSGVVVRTPRQREVLEGIGEDTQDESARRPSRMQLASRSSEARPETYANRADDPDFDPCICPPAPALLRMLTTLAAHSTPARPLEVMSLLRPPYRFGDYVHVGPANPHSLGLAVDIASYGGHPIRQANPQACVAATLALLRDMPPGRYRLGMPKAPEGGWDMPPALVALLRQSGDVLSADASTGGATRSSRENTTKSGSKPGAKRADLQQIGFTPSESAVDNEMTGCAVAALYGLHVSAAKPAWPFFPPPYSEIVDAAPLFSASGSARGASDRGEQTEGATERHALHSGTKSEMKTVLRFQNEAYAPEAALTDPRLRRALEAARRRGVEIVALFPDGADHIHIDVRRNP